MGMIFSFELDELVFSIGSHDRIFNNNEVEGLHKLWMYT